MKTPKEYYQTYLADNTMMELNWALIAHIKSQQPVHAFEFGSGSGKHLKALREAGIVSMGLDISFLNLIHSHTKNDNPALILGDESYLRHLCNFDVVYTCSVMDHIPHDQFEGIIGELKRIANKAVILAETNTLYMGEYYYPHDYEALGFKKMDFKWTSPDDGADYYIWIWEKEWGAPLLPLE